MLLRNRKARRTDNCCLCVFFFFKRTIATENNPAARRGFCLGLGCLTSGLLLPRLQLAVDTLINATKIEVHQSLVQVPSTGSN